MGDTSLGSGVRVEYSIETLDREWSSLAEAIRAPPFLHQIPGLVFRVVGGLWQREARRLDLREGEAGSSVSCPSKAGAVPGDRLRTGTHLSSDWSPRMMRRAWS